MTYREEKDSMGVVFVPSNAYWGAQTERARNNFNISGERLPMEFINAIVIIKMAAAVANSKLELIKNDVADAIVRASIEILEGKFNDQFPLDVFQTGSATSTNMNVNEVIANRTCEILYGEKGNKNICHPNDHVNKGQSSNDVIPSAIHLSSALLSASLISKLNKLEKSLEDKEKEFENVIKIGRTHLMDAVPMTLGQEFSAYKQQIKNSIKRLKDAEKWLLELPIGGTALGTGVNTHHNFAELTISEISEYTGVTFYQSVNLFEGIAAKDAVVYYSGALNSIAVSLMKIANDLRLLSSGPRCGIGEIILPSLQPGSSIMPGKVNPVIPETVIQVATEIMGNHVTITTAGASSLLDLNVMMPLTAYKLIRSLKLLINVTETLNDKCIVGIEANIERCIELVDWSMAIVTPLAAEIGYDMAAEIAYEAFNNKKTVKQIVKEKGILTDEEIVKFFDPANMI